LGVEGGKIGRLRPEEFWRANSGNKLVLVSLRAATASSWAAGWCARPNKRATTMAYKSDRLRI